MSSSIEHTIQSVCQSLFDIKIPVILERPEECFGDLSTNVAMLLASKLDRKPRELANKIVVELKAPLGDRVTEVRVADPGFINMRLSDQELWTMVAHTPAKKLARQKIVIEYSDPNPFKILHAGHVFTTVIGDAIALLLERAGAEVHRVNFGGDVGLHVAKTMYIVLLWLEGEGPNGLGEIPQDKRSEWLASAYVRGHAAYCDDESAKLAIIELNKRIYHLQSSGDHNSLLAQVYWVCREWSYEAFDSFYARLGTKIEKYYPESETTELGLSAVRERIGDVFEESQGAIIFRGEKHGLHNRVFINRQGLPTYETKDVGLMIKKYEDYHFDRSIIITGNEQEQYMGVVLKAVEQFLPHLAKATKYIPHGMLKLTGGVKMSSRLGNIVPALDVINITAEAMDAAGRKPDDDILLASIKYAFLRPRLGRDLIYDPKESVALEGNSGPAILYAHTRAQSILKGTCPVAKGTIGKLEGDERSLLRKLAEYSDVVERSIDDLMPHYICAYLYELAQAFNRFYEHNRVLGHSRQDIRLQLLLKYVHTLKDGLQLINITVPDEM